jgi:protein involved in polysaccharide export with SLBB domain
MSYRLLRFALLSVFVVLAIPLAQAQQAHPAPAQATAPTLGAPAPAPPVAAPGAKAPAAAAAPIVPATTADEGYRLGSGDKIHVGIFGQPDLNGDFVVDGGGSVQLPLIGSVKAAGLTVADFQKEVTAKFADGFLVNPSVEVDVVNYRPFYIIGEVKAPGQYPYVNGMSILNAVALAGGFTDRADKSEVYIRRNGSSKETEYPGDETTKVNPGDIVRISERFF